VSPKSRPVASALALVSFLCGACLDRDEPANAVAFEVDSSGTFPVVSVHSAARWRATPLVSIGAQEGGPVEFASIRSVLLDSAGALIVVDPRNRTVSEFDSTGALARQIGREGAGPGEYRDPYSVAWLDGNLALLDPGNPRLAVFDRAGGWVTSWLTQPITGGQVIRLYRTPPAFFAYAFRRIATGTENIYVGYDSSGPRDTIASAIRPTDLAAGARCDRPDRGISFFSNPYAASFLNIPLSGGRQATARTDAYRVALLDRLRDTTLVLTADATPSAVTDAEWQEGMADWEKFHRDWPTARCDRSSFTRPATKPVLNWLFVDGERRLWIEVLSSDGTRYDVFDADGHPVATVEGLPPSEGIDPSATNGRIAFVVRDSITDVPSVRVFRLSPASRD
jgi:hypothetical protein